MAGDPNQKKQVDYYRKFMNKHGIPLQVLEFDCWAADGATWGPEKSPNIFAEASVINPEERKLDCVDRAGSTGPEGVEGELVNIGRGTDADIEAADVKGKITIVYHPGEIGIGTFPDPNFNSLNYRLLKRLGVKAHINVSWRPFIRQGAQIYNRISYGNPDPEELEALVDLPVIETSKADGEYVKSLMEEGPVTVRVVNKTTYKWQRGLNAFVEVMGTADTDRFVFLQCHHDAIGGSATCPSNGNAVMLEFLRVLWKHRDKLKRNVKWLLWTGHEPYDYNVGCTWWAEQNWNDVKKNCIATIGQDTPFIAKAGLCPGAVGFRSKNSLEVRKFHEQVILDVVPREDWDVEATEDGFFLGDEYVGLSAKGAGWGGYIPMGIPSMGNGRRNSKISPYAHMIEDTIEVGGTPDLFENHIKVLSGHQNNGRSTYDLMPLIKTAQEIKRKAKRLDEEIASLLERYECSDGRQKERFEEFFENVVNTGLMKMSRTFYRSPLRLPGLAPVEELATLDPDSSEFKALRTKLDRARNRVSDTFTDAIEIIENTLQQIGSFSIS
jgi:hypothetical protein